VFAPLFQIALHGFDLDIMMGYMTKNRAQKRFGKATLAGVKKEMAKPCICEIRAEKLCEPHLVTFVDRSKRGLWS
jgi:hypothetical protein